MGHLMARNLLRAGHRVALWSNTAAKAQELAKTGDGIFCQTPADVGAQADYVFLCVGDSAMSQKCILGENGIASKAKKGTVVVDASTIAPEVSRQISVELSKIGISFLDAPCTGSKPGADAGTLTFMIGGEQAVFEAAKPFLEAMGKQFYYCGGARMGLLAKLTQNLVFCNILQAFNEGIVVRTKAGVDPAVLVQ